MLKRCFYVGVAVAVAVGTGGLLVGAIGGAVLVASTYTTQEPPNLGGVKPPGPTLRQAYARSRASLKPNLRTVYGAH